MTKKPKISHFASTDVSDAEPGASSYPDRSELAGKYPQPKSYEQRKKEDALRQQSYRHRMPRYPRLMIALYGSAVLAIVVWFVQNLTTWLFSSSDRGAAMSAVFAAFGVGLVLTFLVIFWVVYTNKQFYYFQGMVRLFWHIYIVVLAALLGLWASGWAGVYTSTFWVPAMALLHFIFVYIGTRVTMKA